MTDDVAGIYADFGDLLSGLVFETDADFLFVQAAGPVPHFDASDPRSLIGRSLFDIAEFMADLQARHVFVHALRRHEKIAGLRYPAPGAGVAQAAYQVSARPLFRDGAFAGYRGIIQDVTISAASEADLVAACQNAEVANRAKSEFLTGISHELRTPLNAIIGFSEILQQEMFGPLGDARYHEYVRDILTSGRSLLSLINDMLDISRLETHRLSIQEDEVNVAGTVSACLEDFEPRFAERRIALDVAINPDLPPLWADGQALRQMMRHLLSNAQKFADTGGSVTVSADRNAAGGLTISVADTGIGIPEDRLEQVLIPFVQNSDGFTRDHGGMGLGLPITKALMELHDGSVTLDSTAGVGTRVDLVFPPERLVDFPGRQVG